MTIVKYHIGTTRWSLKEWVGRFYTEDATPDSFLSQYASVFNAVEGNTTFYRTPDPKTVERWGEAVPDGFKFCFKFPRGITHEKQLAGAGDEILSFIDRFEPIRDHLGPFHIQLDDRFSYRQFSVLEEMLGSLPAEYAYALEVRHPDYFDKGKKENHLVHLLRNLNIDRVVFDTRRLHSLKGSEPSIVEAQKKKPKLPVRFDPTGSRPFLRYVGANDVPNNEAWLKEWAIIVADWILDGRHPYVFIHAPDSVSAPEIARYFHRELARLVDVKPMPEWPVDRRGAQLGLF
ncbi:MAG: DUF72 domain-containing protein [Balneolaceae bacterium]